MFAMPWGMGDTEVILIIKLYDHLRTNGNLTLTWVGRSGDPGILTAFSPYLKSLVSDTTQPPIKWAAVVYTYFTRHLPVVNHQPNDST